MITCARRKANKSKNSMTKLEFVRDVWEKVDEQQQLEMKLAMCGMSDEFELADIASHLEVSPDTWFEWSESQRTDYVHKFNKLTMDEILSGKEIVVTNSREENTMEFREFAEDIKKLYSIKGKSEGLYRTIVKDAEKLLNYPNANQLMPSLAGGGVKYLVAAKT